MKIYRDNIEIELKPDEIEKAYRQYLYEMDKELIKNKLLDIIFEDEYECIVDEDGFYDEATAEFRRNISECDVNLDEALVDAVESTLFKYIENPDEVDEETVEAIINRKIKYFQFHISITHTICVRGHRKPTILELYRYLKTHMANAMEEDFSSEDIHDIEEITKDEAYSRFGMQHIFKYPYIN